MLDKQVTEIYGIRIPTDHAVSDMNENLLIQHKKVDKILKNVTSKIKKMHKDKILRDTVPKTVFEQIINNPKIKGVHSILWARFQLTASVFFLSFF